MAFPSITAVTTYTRGNSTSWTPLSGATVVSGELLIFICHSKGSGTPTTSSTGWSSMGSQARSTNHRVTIFRKVATGSSETLVITSLVSGTFDGVLYRLSGADTISGTATTGSSTNANPPSHDAGASRDHLWIATVSHSSDASSVSASPSGYGTLTQVSHNLDFDPSRTATAERAATAQTEDPGTFTHASSGWISWTLATYAASGGGGQSLTPSLFTNSNAFYGPAVTVGAVTVAPSLFTNSQAFHSPSLAFGQGLTPGLFTNSGTFPGPAITQGGGGGAWEPSELGALLLVDLDPEASAVSDGSQVTSYTNPASAGPSTYTPGIYTGPTRETNEIDGKAVFRFTGSAKQLVSSTNLSVSSPAQAFVMKALGSPYGGDNAHGLSLVFGVPYYQTYARANSSGYTSYTDPAEYTTGIAISSSAFQVVVYWFDGSTMRLRINGAPAGTVHGSVATGTATGPHHFGAFSGTTPGPNLDLARHVYTDTLTQAEVESLEGYLAWEYGLEGDLDASHPYKSAPPTGSGGGSQSVATSLVTNSQTFYGPTITTGSVSLAPSLFTNSQTFQDAAVSSLYTIAPALLSNGQTFHAPSVTTGAITLSPSLFTNSQTLHGPTASSLYALAASLFTNTATIHAPIVAPGAVTLAPSLFTNSQTFYGPTLAIAAATLAPPLFTNSGSFFAATIIWGAVEIAPPPVTNTSQFFALTISPGTVSLAPSLFANDNEIFEAELEQGAGSAQSLAPALLSNVILFHSAAVRPVFDLPTSRTTSAGVRRSMTTAAANRSTTSATASSGESRTSAAHQTTYAQKRTAQG